MRYLLPLLAVLILAAPAEAKGFLVYKKVKGSYPKLANGMWYADKAPKPGVEINADAVVFELEPGSRREDWELINGRLEHAQPKAIPAPTPEQVAEKEIEAKIKDEQLSDADFVKLLRIREIEDPAKKKAEWDKVK